MTTKEISEKTGIPWTTLISWAKSNPAGWRYQLVMAMSQATPEFFSKFNVEQRSEGVNAFGALGGEQLNASSLVGGALPKLG